MATLFVNDKEIDYNSTLSNEHKNTHTKDHKTNLPLSTNKNLVLEKLNVETNTPIINLKSIEAIKNTSSPIVIKSKLREQYEQHYLKQIEKDTKPLLKELNLKIELYVHIHPSSSFTRGERDIFICIWDNINNEVFNYDTIFNVYLHELSHVLCDDENIVGDPHTPEFIKIFDQLTLVAEKLKLFDSSKVNLNYPEHKL
jgi:hypothetical protein